jgi:helicase
MVTQNNLNPAQKEAMERGFLTSGFNVVLQMPTGAGKTWLAELAIYSTLRKGMRAIYLTPLRALANELVERWRLLFDGYEVGVFTGEYGQRRTYPVPFQRAQLLVMTPERLDACTRHWRTHWNWFPEVSLMVVDELHLLGDHGRGARLEGALMRARRLNPFFQLIGLSATIGNRAELADWLGGVHFGTNWRPIAIEWRCVRYRKATDKPQILKEEVERCIASGGQSLVFVQSRRRAEMLSRELCDGGIPAGHHHAGLDSQDRCRVESEYRRGNLRVLVSTGTLEMGLNLPARQVVLYDLQSFDGTDFVPLSINKVWQRAGRVGRRGFDTKGEVVLIAAAWDKTADRYASGQFESILSNIVDDRALAEQVLAEVSSGLAKTQTQLQRNFQQSLAWHQRRLPRLERVVCDMLEGEMLIEVKDDATRAATLKPTRLGRIAVRQMLAPSTVMQLARSFRDHSAPCFTFLDLLLICAQADDCEPLIPVDYDELEELSDRVAGECSTLLSGTHSEVLSRFGAHGRKLLAIVKTALIVRGWTRCASSDEVADDFGCYAFEVRRLCESFERILTASVAVIALDDELTEIQENLTPAGFVDEKVSIQQRVGALAAMVAHGVDETTVTLTFVPGVGGRLARRLREAGIGDLEDLAAAEADDVGSIQGVSRVRAVRLIDEAINLIRTQSAFSFRETGGLRNPRQVSWTSEIDPYRLRRAMDLRVRKEVGGFTVDGGLEPHRVLTERSGLLCDCVDFLKGKTCKHLLAVRLHRQDPILVPLVQLLSSGSDTEQLDLFQLWFDRGNR